MEKFFIAAIAKDSKRPVAAFLVSLVKNQQSVGTLIGKVQLTHNGNGIV
jgi:hypothetical protein